MAIKKSYVIAGLLALSLAGWLASGQIGKQASGKTEPEAAAPASAPEVADRLTVRVRDLVAETIEREMVINGKTAPSRRVEMRAETNGRVIEIVGRKGAVIDVEDVVVRLDPRDRDVVRLEAEALRRQRAIELDAAKKLGEKGFQAETNVFLAEANFAAAEAAMKRALMDLDHTIVKAPFAGVLDKRYVEIGDFVDIGDPIAVVLDQDPYLVTGEVMETEVGKLETGMIGRVRLANGENIEGKLNYVASEANDQTRTFPIELEIDNPSGGLTAGISAEIRLSIEQVLAHRVSSSVLSLADDGTLGVKTVDAEDQVVFLPVEIAKADQSEVWLTGLPETVRLITVGQGFVRDGTKVHAVSVGESGEAGPAEQVVSEAIPGEVAPKEIVPGEAALGETAPRETAPGETAPGETAQ